MPLSDNMRLIFYDYILPIIIFYLIAYFVHRTSDEIAKRYKPISAKVLRENPHRIERLKTLQALLANVITIIAYVVATLVSIGLFVDADTILWVVGLFSAAFGLGMRPFISDFLTGLSFIFEDTFDVGDKIEIPLYPQRVEGVVEKVTLRVTSVRGVDGELFTMPNGDIRLVRNFSRGDSSPTNITVKVPARKISQAIDHLEKLSERAMTLLPNLIEPWQVITKSGELGDEAELTIVAKAKFGKGAEMRTRLLALVQQELSAQGILPEDEAVTGAVIIPES
ncbi:MAG: mechanosensitive ion channel domain-containing protein [Chloroflexota bacterium]